MVPALTGVSPRLTIVAAVGPSGALLGRIRGEFIEMPGLCVTAREAQRLFGLDAATCEKVLESLLRSGFLWRSGDGTFRRSQAADFAALALRG